MPDSTGPPYTLNRKVNENEKLEVFLAEIIGSSVKKMADSHN